MSDALMFLILSLAVWRVCRMWVAEDGPADVLAILRHRLGVPKQATWVQRGLACIACISFWLGLIAGVLWLGPSWQGVAAGLAISAVSVVLMRRVG
jgi:hypothetical protein